LFMSGIFLMIYFLGRLPLDSQLQAYLIVICFALPLSFLGILPNAILADIAEHDALASGIKQEGMFFAARTLMQKFGQTFGVLLFAALTTLGKDPGHDLGIRLSGDSRESLIANVFPASPALEAGLAVGDVLLALDGQRAHADNLDRLLQPYHPGDKITLTVFRREELRRFEVLLGGGKNTVLNLWESPEASDAQIRLRDGWLGGE
ncbi:MAG: PDZ domain-containing protein, partial [Calditrichaeota bacterium]|nr:PDZ domain-containing protein [Calditrichota bacterium]